MIHQGCLKATEDIDLLLEESREVKANDLDEYTVVRMADDIVVDLMLSACGVKYSEAVAEIETRNIQGCPFPSLPPDCFCA